MFPSEYLLPNFNQTCYSVAFGSVDLSTAAASIFGDIFLQQLYLVKIQYSLFICLTYLFSCNHVVFDRVTNQVGFGPLTACSTPPSTTHAPTTSASPTTQASGTTAVHTSDFMQLKPLAFVAYVTLAIAFVVLA